MFLKLRGYELIGAKPIIVVSEFGGETHMTNLLYRKGLSFKTKRIAGTWTLEQLIK